MDEEYQKKRREEMNKRPADLREGLARGGRGLVMVDTLKHLQLHMIIIIRFIVIDQK